MNPLTPDRDRRPAGPAGGGEDRYPADDLTAEEEAQYQRCLALIRGAMPEYPDLATSGEDAAQVAYHIEAARRRARRMRRLAIAAGIAALAASIFTADRFNRAAVAQDALEAVREEVSRLRSELAELRRLIERSGLEDAVRVPDPPFAVAGRDRIAVRGSADARYIAEVAAIVGAERRVLLRRDQPAEHPAREPFEAEFAVELGSGRLDAALEVTPFEAVAEDFRPFFGPDRLRREQTFLASSFGLILNPSEDDLYGVAELVDIALQADDENPTRYVVGGHLRRTGDHNHAWLIIAPIFSDEMYVGGALSLIEGTAADGDRVAFRGRCPLGTRIDHEVYRIFVVTGTGPDALHDGQQISPFFDWDAHGFRKSKGRFKVNDGQAGFEAELAPSR